MCDSVFRINFEYTAATITQITKMIETEELPTSSKGFDCQENVNTWSCSQCGFSSHVLPSLIRHKEAGCANKVDNLNFLQDAYKCRNCKFVSCSYIITSRHETKCCIPNDASCADSASWWMCSHCEFTVSYRSVNLDKDEFECGDPGCNYTCTKIEGLKQHATVLHLPDECLKFLFAQNGVKSKSIEQCGQEFDGKVEHEFKCKKTWFSCHNCEYKCKHKFRLHQHIINKHQFSPVGDIHWYECQECPYKATRSGHLRRHKMRQHTSNANIMWFKCEECGYKSKIKDNLKQHMLRQHTSRENIKWFKCEECGYKSNSGGNLNQHRFRKHTPSGSISWFKCQECGHKSKSKGDLRQHRINKHTSVEKIKWFDCQECEYRTKKKSDLRRHAMRRHSPSNVKNDL